MTRTLLILLMSALILVGSAPLASAVDEELDADGRVLRSEADDGTVVEYTYDEDGNLIEERQDDGTVVRIETDGTVVEE